MIVMTPPSPACSGLGHTPVLGQGSNNQAVSPMQLAMAFQRPRAMFTYTSESDGSHRYKVTLNTIVQTGRVRQIQIRSASCKSRPLEGSQSQVPAQRGATVDHQCSLVHCAMVDSGSAQAYTVGYSSLTTVQLSASSSLPVCLCIHTTPHIHMLFTPPFVALDTTSVSYFDRKIQLRNPSHSLISCSQMTFIIRSSITR